MKELTSGDVVKLEAGDRIDGEFVAIEQSKQFADSYAVHIGTPEGNKVVFVNNIVRDLIEKNGVLKGTKIAILFKGLKKSEKTGREYKDYSVFAD